MRQSIPSVGPTKGPSSVPTVNPTYDRNYPLDPVYISYQAELRAMQSVDLTVTFGSFYYKGLVVDGDCAAESAFLRNSLTIGAQQGYTHRALMAWFSVADYSADASRSLNSSCEDVAVVAGVVNGLKSKTSYGAECNNHFWRTFACNQQSVFCVDCDEQCPLACPNDQFTISPCSSCVSNAASGAILSVQFAPIIHFPLFSGPIVVSDVGKTSVLVTVTIDRAGTVYCGALPSGATVLSVLDIRSVASDTIAPTGGEYSLCGGAVC